MKTKKAYQALLLLVASGGFHQESSSVQAVNIKSESAQVENLQLMILTKNNNVDNDVSEDNVLLQIDSNIKQEIEEKANHQAKQTSDEKQGDDNIDTLNLDSLMKKYDDKEKVEQQNRDFIKILKTDDKILSFFIQNYQPGSDDADDERYISYEFSKYCEQGWSEDGHPMDKDVLSKKKARLFAQEVVMKWKGYDVTENSSSNSQAKSEKFLDQNKRFDKAWKKFDKSKAQSGMLDMMEAHQFMKNIIIKPTLVERPLDDNDENEKVAEDFIAKTLL